MTESEKAVAGRAAADEVRSGMVLGLGTGSTVYFFLEELGRRIKQGLDVRGIATSERTAQLAQRFGIPLTSFEEFQELDLSIDGADEVDPQLSLIKGQGGALLREKIVASTAKRRVYVVDSSKLSPRLGTKSLLAVEVFPFAWKVAERELRALGCEAQLRADRSGVGGPEPALQAPKFSPGDRSRGQTAVVVPFKTDNGNYILDCRLPSDMEAAKLEQAINCVPGVIENGLFVGLTDAVIVGRGHQTETLTASS